MMPTPALDAVPQDHQERVPGKFLKASRAPGVTWASEIIKKSRLKRSLCAQARLSECPATLDMKKPWAFHEAPA